MEHVTWCSDGKELATAAGRALRLWSNDGPLLRSYSDNPSTISDIKWVPAKAEALRTRSRVHPVVRYHEGHLTLSWQKTKPFLSTEKNWVEVECS